MDRRTPALLSSQGSLGAVVVAGRGRASIVSARFGGVGAWRVRRNSAVFYVAEIVAAKMLLFFRKSAPMDILT